MQSLAQEIKSFSKTNLRKQCTRVTTLSGRRIIETWKGSSVHVVEDTVQTETTFGYVQDTSWDLQVGAVKPHLLLGSQDAAHDFGTMRKFKVTHILNVAYGVENAFPDLFIYKTLSILDQPDTDIISYLQECTQFIEQAKAERGVVLVHCNSGVSRCAAVVIGYLMSREGQAFDDALALVKSARPASCPNPGFLDQLKSYKPQANTHINGH
ncbi:dual specificity protein phosphatase 19a [Clupea harengus]|uniref:Dual specificity protein phosphatase 19a n=1 Tax=Clupea harengus TaxID=7950 RepID=A0A6P8H3Q2_CLUHA|nr:dual specificity protein phosphatase 19a [Clupea harengus]XP_042566278.1 dual specificity protein phosphatase 19a [Clupea harengus]